MRLKEGVDPRNVHPGIWIQVSGVDVLHKQVTGQSAVVTDLRGPRPGRASGHDPEGRDPVWAADLRRWYLDEKDAAEPFALLLRYSLRGILEVVLEPEWLSPVQIEERGGPGKIDPHLHLELSASYRDLWRSWGLV